MAETATPVPAGVNAGARLSTARVITTVTATTIMRPTNTATVPIPLFDLVEELKAVPINERVCSRYLAKILSQTDDYVDKKTVGRSTEASLMKF